MSPRTEKQFEEIRIEKKQLIFNAALTLFADNGYHSTSISQIAKQANVSKGLIYNYFDSKEDLLKIIIDNGINEMFKNFDINKDGIIEISEMKYYLEKTFESLKTNRRFWKFYFQISVQADAQLIIKEKIETMLAPIMIMIISFFEKQGFEDPETEAYVFGALMDGVGMDYVFQPDLIPIDKIKDNIINKYCRTV